MQPRPLNFGDAARHLKDQKADVIIAFFGLNESFDGEAGLPAFEKDLDAYLATHQQAAVQRKAAPYAESSWSLQSPTNGSPGSNTTSTQEARNRELAR